MTKPVFLGEDLRPTPEFLSVGDMAVLGGTEGHHAGVKRIHRGDLIDVVDGLGLRLICEVTETSKNEVKVQIKDRVVEEAPAQQLILVQALAKGGHDEQAISQATEIGVDRVIPWMASRCEVHWRGPKADKGQSKWQSTVKTAAKQSRRALVPTVAKPRGSNKLARWIAEFVGNGGLCLLCHEEATQPLTALLRENVPLHDVAVVVGPEGGVTPDEVESFQYSGATLALLGPHVLRSASAGPAALTLVSAAVGRW